MRKAVAMGLILAALLGTFSGEADARKKKVRTVFVAHPDDPLDSLPNVSLNGAGPERVFGKISARKAACRANRRMDFFKNGVFIVSDTTDASGIFDVSLEFGQDLGALYRWSIAPRRVKRLRCLGVSFAA